MSLKTATIIAIVGLSLTILMRIAGLFKFYFLYWTIDMITSISLLIFFIVLMNKQIRGGKDE